MLVDIEVTPDCIACLRCSRACPAEILKIKTKPSENKRTKKKLVITSPKDCFECRACEVVCHKNAIFVG